MKAQNSGRKTRLLHVVRAARLTPNMHRVTLGGSELADFPTGQESAHIKLFVPESGQPAEDFGQLVRAGSKDITRRTYTVRHHRPDAAELDIDFVVHEGGGPACDWALRARPGDVIGVAGPGPIKTPDHGADWFLFGADMAAIPAAAAALEALPQDAVGHAIFEITTDDDIQPVRAPAGIKIHWLVHEDPHVSSTQQLEFFRALDWSPGVPGVFVAGESGAVAGLRSYLINERGLDKRKMYISAYWKIGLIEKNAKAA
ncbi:siderophore-interacting protein [Hoeflea poritis]|uniref:Siderophore-interacting protein n=1 Tax=Hoeflea poritis TaxID=2993659 RepID=A0ABT4VTX1_9HYPH|nr:siderophore-interacting protein [Hoeflea poritis]MDA4848157.1 siderophore-interacting protein [Hoeflea poritis]